MQNNSQDGVDQVNANAIGNSRTVEMPQRLSNAYFKYRLWISFITNIIVWTTTTGFISVLVVVLNLIKMYFGPEPSLPKTHGELLALIIFYILPMFTCIRLHKWWLVRYFKSYQWDLTNEVLHIHEGVFTRKDTRILLSTIQSTGITQGYWERKYGWFKVTILVAGMSRDSNDALPHIAARIRGCQEPHVIQELIENAALERNPHAGNEK